MPRTYLLFDAGAALGALPSEAVVEVMRPLPRRELPNTPDFFCGVAVVRGEPIPVIDVGAVLTGVVTAEPRRMVVVRTETDRRIALLVSSVRGLAALETSTAREISGLLDRADAGAVAAIGRHDEELLLVLQAAHLVPDALWTRLGEGR